MASDVDGQPLVRPPRLRTGQEATASRLEPFFDLAYVLVVLELASTFSRAPRLHSSRILRCCSWRAPATDLFLSIIQLTCMHCCRTALWRSSIAAYLHCLN